MSPNLEQQKKDCWDKFNIIASVLITPIAICLIGYWLELIIQKSEHRIKNTEIALTILKEAPSENTKEIRKWAVDLLRENQKYSTVEFTQKLADELLRTGLIVGCANITDSKDSIQTIVTP